MTARQKVLKLYAGAECWQSDDHYSIVLKSGERTYATGKTRAQAWANALARLAKTERPMTGCRQYGHPETFPVSVEATRRDSRSRRAVR